MVHRVEPWESAVFGLLPCQFDYRLSGYPAVGPTKTKTGFIAGIHTDKYQFTPTFTVMRPATVATTGGTDLEPKDSSRRLRDRACGAAAAVR